MGLTSIPLVLSLLAAAVPTSKVPTSEVPAPEAATMASEAFVVWLQQSNLEELELGCIDPAIGMANARRQQIRDRLLVLHPAPQSFDVVLANATALLRCGSPDSAAVVLQRTSPGSPLERRQWLLLRWRAAAAGLDHREAALALRRLVGGDLQALSELELEPGLTGLDQLAAHEAALGRRLLAAELQLMVPSPSPRQLSRAAEWLAPEAPERADDLLESALDQASTDQAWGLAVELLQQQLRLQHAAGRDGDRPRQRLESLTAQLEDYYSQWQLQGGGAEGPLLRSPRTPGGHAAVGDSSDVSLP